MSICYYIEDESHAEQQSVHNSFEAAVEELKRLASIPWDEEPNTAPCQSWTTCGRQYVIIEYEMSTEPWKMLRRVPALEISAQGVMWDKEIRAD